MQKTFFIIRIIFLILCVLGAWLVWYAANYDEREHLFYYLLIGALLGIFTILVDVFLKGFSLRGLTALTFGLGMGALVAFLLSVSPLFEEGDPETLFLARLGLFIVCTYLGAVIALRGRDEFNLVIPYVRFVPQRVEMPIVVVDTSVLMDGRVVGICKSGFLTAEIVIPRFVIDELQRIADSNDPVRQNRGRRGLQILTELRKLKEIRLEVHESEVGNRQQVEDKLIFIADSLKGRILTTDYNLAKVAEFHNVGWLNINSLAKVLNPEVAVGEKIEVELVKTGKEADQAVGFLSDGSMVVVNEAVGFIGQTVQVEIISVLPSAGGKLVFANMTH